MHAVALDTNAYSALGQNNSTILGSIRQANSVGLPITVLGEIYFGSLNGSKYAVNMELLERFLANSRVEILQITNMTAKLYCEIATELRRAGRPVQQNDIWIAALCKQYDYKLITNDAGFAGILGLDIVSF